MSAPPKSITSAQEEVGLLRRLHDSAQRLELSLTPAQRAALLAYLDLLSRWGAVYNLTAVRDPAQALTQHIVDCMSIIHPLRRAVRGFSSPRVLDVGSGAGLPGMVIAAVCPEVHVTCVDSVGKKVAFIREAAATLQLRNVEAVHSRIENLSPGRFDVVTSRAFASLAQIAGQTQAQLAVGGMWMCMKGHDPMEERHDLPSAIDAFHVEQISVPELEAERRIVWMRRSGTIAKSMRTQTDPV